MCCLGEKKDYGIPVNYVPLSQNSISNIDVVGPHKFTIKHSSHLKHIEYLELCFGHNLSLFNGVLYPFEVWSMARVLSSAHFGKLNEVVSLGGVREILDKDYPGNALNGVVTKKRSWKRNGLSMGDFDSYTYGADENVIMRSYDKLLFLNDSDDEVVFNAVNSMHLKPVVFVNRIAYYKVMDFEMKFRYKWSEDLWLNNIHTDNYARKFGYRKGLAEGPCLIDMAYVIFVEKYRCLNGVRFSWKYKFPIYGNMNISVFYKDLANDCFEMLFVEQASDIIIANVKGEVL